MYADAGAVSGMGGAGTLAALDGLLYSPDGLLKLWLWRPMLLDMMATESGRAFSPPKWSMVGKGTGAGRRGGDLGSRAASRCLRKASSWASAFCFLLILLPETLLWLPRVSLLLLLRRKPKLERCWPAVGGCASPWVWGSWGNAVSSGEPSLVAGVDVLRDVLAMVGTATRYLAKGPGRLPVKKRAGMFRASKV
jgi:hypothetical protein